MQRTDFGTQDSEDDEPKFATVQIVRSPRSSEDEADGSSSKSDDDSDAVASPKEASDPSHGEGNVLPTRI